MIAIAPSPFTKLEERIFSYFRVFVHASNTEIRQDFGVAGVRCVAKLAEDGLLMMQGKRWRLAP